MILSWRGKRFCLNKEIFRGECAAQTRLSEAQSELDRREWKMQSADRALHESGIQLQSQEMDLYQANQLTDQSRREKGWHCEESEMRNRAFQDDRVKSYQERLELRRITEAESARQLRIYELSTQEEENQLMVQIQDLQNKVNSLSDAKEFFDSEKARGSGLSHVPSQTMSCSESSRNDQPRFLLATCYPEFNGYTRLFFHNLPAPGEPSAAIFGNSRNIASASCGPVSLNTRRLSERANDFERDPQNFAIPTPRFASKFSAWSPPS